MGAEPPFVPFTTASQVGKYTTDNMPSLTAAPGSTLTGFLIGLASGQTGTFTANGATPVTVANTNVTANSVILITLKTVGGTVGAIPTVKTITPGTGFTVAGTASDTSVYNYAIIG